MLMCMYLCHQTPKSRTEAGTSSATNALQVSYHIIYHIVGLKRQNRLKVATDKPKLTVKMQSVSDDDFRKRLLEKRRSFELAVKGVFRLGRCYILQQGVPGLWTSNGKANRVI